MPKFFVPKENVQNNKILINNEDVAHITKVLRCKLGDELNLCDGCGTDYTAVISQIENKQIICDITANNKSDTEPNVNITLFQGIPKAAKMEYIIQKNTELGVTKIVPCIMSRCVVKLSDGADKKIQRWQKVAQEAAKQSGRGIIPEITPPVTFDEALKMLKQNDIYFAPYECETTNTLRSALKSCIQPKTIGFMIGPEGGYALDEIEKLKLEQISTVTLGKRILRTETAGEAVLAMTMYEFGDINIERNEKSFE